MTMHIKVGGVWKDVSVPSVKVGGAWKDVSNGYVKVGGAWKEFYSSFTPSDTIYTSSTSITVPAGATQIIAEVIGAGGGGGAGFITGGPWCGGGGGGSAYAIATKSLSGDSGKTITITVGSGGTGGIRNDSQPSAGGLSRIQATTLTNNFQITGGGGGAATNGVSGSDGLGGSAGSATLDSGSATGVTLTNGNAGEDGDGLSAPVPGGTGFSFSGGGTVYGTGGNGVNTATGGTGSNGAVRIRFS